MESDETRVYTKPRNDRVNFEQGIIALTGQGKEKKTMPSDESMGKV